VASLAFGGWEKGERVGLPGLKRITGEIKIFFGEGRGRRVLSQSPKNALWEGVHLKGGKPIAKTPERKKKIVDV